MSSSILTDEPNPEDLLDFGTYADALSNVIQESSPRFAIGVFGGWGTGKTTLMQMIKSRLDSKADILTVWFNAWRYEREENLAIIPLLRVTRLALENNIRFSGLRKALERSMSGLINATKARVGPFEVDFGKMVKEATDFGVIGPSSNTLYYDSLGYLEASLKKLRENNGALRLIVFVDDLDRCSPERALEVLESMKALLDIEGVIYVIGLNENTVNAAIRERHGEDSGISGSDYLKKIIQLPFHIPGWSESDLSKFLARLITTRKKSLEVFSEYHDLIIKSVDRNPREVKRFLNQILLTKAFLDKPIDGLIVVQAMLFNSSWRWFLDYLFDESNKNEFLVECEAFLKDKTKDVEGFQFKDRISLLAKDESLQDFLKAGSLAKLQEIPDLEEYRRALATAARAPSIALSAATGTSMVTFGIRITGAGFPGLHRGTGVNVYFKRAGQITSVSGATQVSTSSQEQPQSPVADQVTPDDNGNFTAYFDVPALPAGTYNVFASYTPSGGSTTYTAPVRFTIAPYLDVRLANETGDAAAVPTSRFVRLGQWVRIRVYGFGASETVIITGLPVEANTVVTLTTNANGRYSKEAFIHLIGQTTPGSKTIIATGLSSGVTAARSFTIM